MASPPETGSPPASSDLTFLPASASRAATVPPPAPEPTTTYSQSACISQFLPYTRSKRFEEFDQRQLVGVAQAGLLDEVAGAEVVAAVHDEVRTLAERKQLVDQIVARIGKYLGGVCVAG